MDNIQGTQLEGRYLIEELVGVGGMANVYKAFDTTESRTVAVKMLRDEFLGNEEILRCFRNESKAIYSLNHPNIVKIYDVVLQTRNPFIVMEYVDGITLKDYIGKKGVIAPRIAVALTIQILTAMAHAHDNGIVHSDLKPQNVMIKSDGTIKVMDFGIARFAMSQARGGSAIGSVHYVSPEQARGDENVDNRTDLYSTGVMLYEMITGRLPFDADSPASVAQQHVAAQPASPRELIPELPLGLDQITMHAMAKDPDLRYQTAADMLADLESYARDPNSLFSYDNIGAPKAKDVNTRAAAAGQSRSGKKFGWFGNLKLSYLTVLFAVTCAFVIGSLSFLGLMFVKYRPFAKVDDTTCPNLVGIQYEQAADSSRYSSVKIVIETQEFNSGFPVGEIYEQSPKAGKTIKVGSTIKVKVSNGPLTVTLPGFANQEATAVYAKLIELGLYYDVVEINSDSIGEGYVVRTEPAADSVVNAASTVQVYVSRGSGKEMVIVPDVVGSTMEEANTLLRSHNLVPNVVYTTSHDVEEGTVLSQSPGNNSRVPIGTAITITVASDNVSTSQVTVKFLPPDIDEEVTFTAVLDGEQVFSKTCIPSGERTISISFQGESTSLADIYINGELFGSVKIDFAANTYEWTVDNSAKFEPTD